MATRPKAVIESRNGEKLSPITIAKNVLTDDGQNLHDILSDRKEDMMTPTIENSSSMFKVGQGDNVDYSSNVVNGAYESIVLKGKTMVNCIQESSSKDVVLPYAFEDGQNVTINDTKESGALGVELKGQTLVNLNKMVYPVTSWGTNVDNNNYYRDDYTLASGMIKPSTKYLFKVYGLSNIHEVILQGTSATTFVDSNGRYRFDSEGNLILTSTENIHEYPQFVPHFKRDTVNNLTTEEMNSLKMIILEYQDGMENWDIPYFTGMASCKMPSLHTVGKNLFDLSRMNEIGGGTGHTINLSNNSLTTSDNNTHVTGKGYIITGLKKNTPYRLTVTNDLSSEGTANFNVCSRDGSVWYEQRLYNIPIGSTQSRIIYTDTGSLKVSANAHNPVGCTVTLKDIQIEEVASENVPSTSYELHKSSILSLPEEVVLRGIPNSNVHDTLNLQTGVYTRNVFEYTLNGSESYANLTTDTWTDEYMAFLVNLELPPFNFPRHPNRALASSTAYVEGFNYDGTVTHAVNREGWYIGNGSSPNYLGFRIKRSRLTEYNDSPREWIRANNIRILLNIHPVTTKINLPSTLKSWNTTTHIYSEIPENTLYPTLSHSNPSYPVILKPSTKYSIVANSYSNGHTNSAINFNLGGATASTTVSNRVTTITTPSALSNELLTMSGRGNKLNNVMVIEGDVVGDEPYFEGICDCKSPILSNVGKNLFNINGEISEKFSNMVGSNNPNEVDGNTIIASSNTNGHHGRGQKIKIRRGMPYTCSFTSSDNGRIIIHTPYKVNFTWAKPSTFTFIAPTDCDEIIIAFNTLGTASGGKIHNLCVIEGDMTSAEYEPYKSNILSCETYFDETTQSDKTIVLRSLPNGVCDTLNVETGEYVQRIGEIDVLNTIANWVHVDNVGIQDTNTLFRIAPNPSTTGVARDNVLSNKFPTKFVVPSSNNDEEVVFGEANGGNSIYISIRKSRLQEESIEGFKQWLIENPTIIQYELKTPIIKTVDLSGYPFAYENGHVILSSGSIEQSLTPKVEYSVATNRNGQIRSNQKMVERHQKQLDHLQAMILTNLVNTQYEQTLTNLKYDLKNVREEVK